MKPKANTLAMPTVGWQKIVRAEEAVLVTEGYNLQLWAGGPKTIRVLGPRISVVSPEKMNKMVCVCYIGMLKQNSTQQDDRAAIRVLVYLWLM